VFGFSDLQADIAAELVRKGVQVTIFNQRSVEEIFAMLYQVAAMVGPRRRRPAPAGRHAIAPAGDRGRRPSAAAAAARVLRGMGRAAHQRHPLGVGAGRHCRGDDVFPELAVQAMGKDRIIADGAEIVRRNPDIVVGRGAARSSGPRRSRAAGVGSGECREGQQLFEIKSADILQPGGGVDGWGGAAASAVRGVEQGAWLGCWLF
jgi:iron complex transport system substrate-binding protein